MKSKGNAQRVCCACEQMIELGEKKILIIILSELQGTLSALCCFIITVSLCLSDGADSDELIRNGMKVKERPLKSCVHLQLMASYIIYGKMPYKPNCDIKLQ